MQCPASAMSHVLRGTDLGKVPPPDEATARTMREYWCPGANGHTLRWPIGAQTFSIPLLSNWIPSISLKAMLHPPQFCLFFLSFVNFSPFNNPPHLKRVLGTNDLGNYHVFQIRGESCWGNLLWEKFCFKFWDSIFSSLLRLRTEFLLAILRIVSFYMCKPQF